MSLLTLALPALIGACPGADCSNVSVIATSSASVIYAGETVLWSAVVENQSTSTAMFDVVARFTLPAQLLPVEIWASQGRCTRMGMPSCQLGTLVPTETVAISLLLLARDFGSVTGSVSLELTGGPDEMGFDNQQSIPQQIDPWLGPCGSIGPLGQCSGLNFETCEDRGQPTEQITAVDCSMMFPVGIRPICALIDGTTGYRCAVQPREPCSFPSGFAYCAQENGACVFGVSTSSCEVIPTPAGCAASVGQCFGNRLGYACHGSQLVARDCDAFVGRCADGACVDLGDNQSCERGPTSTLRCRPELECVDTVIGPRCRMGTMLDAGFQFDVLPYPDADPGDAVIPGMDATTNADSGVMIGPPIVEDEGCSCRATTDDRAAGLWALGLIGLAVFRRQVK